LPLSLIAASEIAVNRRRGTVLDNVDRFVAPTAFLGDRLVEMGLPPDRIVVKPHFVTDPGARTRPAAESDEVVFVGRLAAGKGIELLVEAWEEAALPGLRLVVMGDGPLRPWLEERAGPTVEVAGWCEHDAVMARLLDARSLVFTSEWFEPFGMVLIEALGAGLPVVATDVAGVRGILDPPAHLVVPPGRADLLAGALAHLADPAVVAAESARARARFEDHFTESANLPLLEAIYADAIAHRGVR
jgi:glycosyltransferase involved in cell wall biosynthesis